MYCNSLLFSSLHADIWILPSTKKHPSGFPAHLSILSLHTDFFTNLVTKAAVLHQKNNSNGGISTPTSSTDTTSHAGDHLESRAADSDTDFTSDNSTCDGLDSRITYGSQGCQEDLVYFLSVTGDPRGSKAVHFTIEFPNHTPETIHDFLAWCYTGTYSVNSSTEDTKKQMQIDSAQLESRLYDFADQLVVPELKAVALSNSEAHLCVTHLGGVSEDLVEALELFVTSVYQERSPGADYDAMRKVAVNAAVEMICTAPWASEKLKSTFKVHGDFAADVIAGQSQKAVECVTTFRNMVFSPDPNKFGKIYDNRYFTK